MIKIGKYTITDWEFSENFNYHLRCDHISLEERSVYIDDFYFSKIKIMSTDIDFYIYITENSFAKLFNVIHGVVEFNLTNSFDSFDEAKDCVDNTLEKLSKLKVFI